MQHNSGASDDNGLPLYMRNDAKNYWFEYLKDSKTLYINYKRVLIDPQDSLRNFCKRIEEFVNANEIERTVIDIRNNGGGNNATCQPFVNLVSKNPKMNQKGKLFVIIGRQTFSAASYLTTKLEFNTKAIFVGEPTGASPNHYGDNRQVILPNSKLEARFSSIYWQNSFAFDKRTATEPSLRVEVSSRDYFSGNDPVLNAVLSYKPESAANTSYSKNIAGTYLYSPLQTLEIKDDGKNLNMLVMMSDFVGRNVSFISTSLYPAAGTEYKTDIEGLSVSQNGGNLKCNFRGNEWVIKKAPADYKTPQQLLDEGKHNEAVSLLKEVRESNPAYSGVSEMVINTLGYYALGKKNYEGAIAVFAYNVELYPESSNVYDSLGEAYMMAGSYKEAIDNYKRSVELNPKNENAKKMIANLSK
ncbi:MAG: tetratricopeptide repeat protein [Ignavibacteria bacterium]